MTPSAPKTTVTASVPTDDHAEILICSDGRILAHNITPTIATLLSQLAPHDTAMRIRAGNPSLQSLSKQPDPRIQ